MAKKSPRQARRPSQGNVRHQGYYSGSEEQLSGPGDPPSGSGIVLPRCRYLPKDQPVPVCLALQLDAPLEGGKASARQQLNRPVLLIYAQDPAFACCWFSRPIDLGDDGGNPAFWMLQKTASDTWFLCLRRVSGELAAYNLKAKNKPFPIQLKKGKTGKDFKWPATITISQGVTFS
jgi:hypothetical protein